MTTVRIRRRGKTGIWQADVDDLPDGSRLQFSLHTRDEAEAKRKRDELQRQYLAGLRPEPGLTVAAWLERWVAQMEAERQTPTTVRAYRYRLPYVTKRVGRRPLGELTIADVQAMDADLLARGGKDGRPLDVQTVRGIHDMLAAALHEAMRHDLLLRNVAALARRPKAPRREQAVLDDRALDRLLNGAPDHEWRGFAALGAYTGMRVGELVGLMWADVDMDGAEIHVRRQRRYEGPQTGWVDAPTKSAAGARIVPLGENALHVLQMVGDRQKEAVRATGRLMPGYVFCHWRAGDWRPYAANTASAGVRSLYAAAGLPEPKRPVHALRHTLSTMLADEGAHPRVQQGVLGHKNERQSLAYTHRLRKAEREAIVQVDKRIGGDAL